MKITPKLLNTVRGMAREIRKLRRWVHEPRLVHAEIDKNCALFEIEHWAVKLIAQSVIDSFKSEPDAINYMQFAITDPETHEQYIVQIRKQQGKEPSQIVSEQKARLREIAALADGPDLGNSATRLQMIHGIATR